MDFEIMVDAAIGAITRLRDAAERKDNPVQTTVFFLGR